MDFRVRMGYGMGDFEEKAKRLMDDISLESQDIVRRSAVVFANAAAKWTPPRRGGSPSMTIPKEKYERPFVLLSVLVAVGQMGKAQSVIIIGAQRIQTYAIKLRILEEAVFNGIDHLGIIVAAGNGNR